MTFTPRPAPLPPRNGAMTPSPGRAEAGEHPKVTHQPPFSVPPRPRTTPTHPQEPAPTTTRPRPPPNTPDAPTNRPPTPPQPEPPPSAKRAPRRPDARTGTATRPARPAPSRRSRPPEGYSASSGARRPEIGIAVHEIAGRPASTSLDRRDRHLTRENVPLADDLAGQVTISRNRRLGGARAGAPAEPTRPNGAPARSTTARLAGARADADIMDPAEADDHPPHRAHAGPACPDPPQRPRPSRSAREETLIFRTFTRRRSRPGAPLQQIRTHPHPEPHHKPHPPHSNTH